MAVWPKVQNINTVPIPVTPVTRIPRVHPQPVTNLKFNPVYSFHDSAFVKEPADFGDKYRFVGKKGDKVKRVNFDDVQIVVV